MTALNTITYLIVNLFHIYVFLQAYRVLIGQSRCKQIMEYLCFGGFYLINSAAFLLIGNPFLNLATTLLPLLALTFLYPGKIRTKCLKSVFVCVASMLLESVSLSILQLFSASTLLHQPIMVNLMGDMLLFAVELIYRRSHQENAHRALQLEYWLAVIFLPVSSITITAFVYSGGGYRPEVNIVIVSLLIGVNILAFHLYEVLDQYYFSHYEHSLLQQQNDAYAHELTMIQTSNEAAKTLRHNMRNHLSVIHQMLQDGKLADLDAYLKAFSSYDVKGEYIDTGNPAIDSILNYKLAAAEAAGAELQVETVLPRNVQISQFDTSVIFGNLMDNAIEAITKCCEKKLWLNIRVDRGILYFHLVNPYSKALRKAIRDGNTVYETQKVDPQLHGIGLSSVAQRVAKYDGILKIDDSNQMFTVDVMLYLTQ